MAKKTKTKAFLGAALDKAERTLLAFKAWHRLDQCSGFEHLYVSPRCDHTGMPYVSVRVRGVSKAHGGVAWVTQYGQRCSEPIFVDDLINLWLGLSEEHPLHAAGRAISFSAGRWCDEELKAA
jgi:hypothetical protein